MSSEAYTVIQSNGGGEWAACVWACHAYVQARDTADTADTLNKAVSISVGQFTLADGHDHEVLPHNSQRVSPVCSFTPGKKKIPLITGKPLCWGGQPSRATAKPCCDAPKLG